MRVQSKDYGSCFPFFVAGLLILLGMIGWWTWRFKKLRDAHEAAHTDLKSLKRSLGDYASDNEDLPTTSQGLDALLRPPTAIPLAKNWRGPYGAGMVIPRDPWGNPYVYRFPGYGKAPFDLFSCGSDGVPDTPDDIRP
jgi:type II secretion system protein G